MGNLWRNLLFLALLMMPTLMMMANQGRGSNVAFAEDTMEGEDDDGTVETETAGDDDATEDTESLTEKEGSEEEEAALKPSPDADTFVLFRKPANPLELPAGKQVRILVGFTNKGDSNFIVDNMEAAFRYPQDFTFFLQNFTTMPYNSNVVSKQQATFEYGFLPNDAFSGRPFGLTVLLNYRDAEGNIFQNAVFNETIQVVEADEGLDGETFFLYVFLAAIVVLLLVGAQQIFASFGKKRMSKPRAPVEMGTQNSDIDYDWIPKETLQHLNKSPRRSPKQSPRQRRNLRSSGSKED